MSEEEIKEALRNVLIMQNNNDANFQILQAQIDRLEQKIEDLNDIREMFRLPRPGMADPEQPVNKIN